MGRYYNSVSWSTLGLIMCLLFALFLPGGISTVIENNKAYELPVYVSENVSVTGYSVYTVTGELTNLTNENVVIERLEITLTGNTDNTKYSTEILIKNITVPANSSYQIYSPGHSFKNKYGTTVASGELENAYISDCVIDGESVKLKKYDGEHFVDLGLKQGGEVIMIVTGSIALIGAIAIVIYKVKDRYY